MSLRPHAHTFVATLSVALLAALLLLLLLLAAGPAAAQETPAPKRALPDTFKVMTYNVLYATPDEGTIRAIRAAGADVVGLQEISEPRLRYIANELGFYYHHNGDHEASFKNDTGLLSRYPISAPTRYGATLYLTTGDPVHIYNVHLSPYPYEPYDLRDGKLGAAEAVAQARATRFVEIQPVLRAMREQLGRGEPVFLTGDFNEPSHLDWTAAAAEAGLHLGQEVAWPTSKEITRHGLADAFRTVYPDEVERPGATWTTLADSTGEDSTGEDSTGAGGPEEVHDRIDMVYYAGEGVRAVDAYTLGLRPGHEATDRAVEGYPSDHRSVVGVFTLGAGRSEDAAGNASSGAR